MDRDESLMQEEKIALIKRMVALLEEVAFNTSAKLIERNTYLEGIYAGSKQSAAAVHGDLRTQPATRQGEVPKHVPGQDARVRGHIDPRLAQKETIIG